MARTSRWAVPLLVLALLGGFAAGIWGTYRMVFPGRGLYRVSGVFQARIGETSILVDHEALPGLMGEMGAMALSADSGDLLDRAALTRGDRLQLTLRQVGDSWRIVDLKKLP